MHAPKADARVAVLASGLSLIIGVLFIFVRAPHPWGWEGIDRYRDLGFALARGEPYPSLERVWGYPYFLAAFYRLFGDRQWIPLVVQAALNATIPLMVFVEARRRIDGRTAAVAALLTGVLSFNTIYASTQAADAVCTVLFVAAVVWFGSASASASTRLFAASGLLAGLALLFRPNLLLFPAFLALADLVTRRRRGWRPMHMTAFVLAAAAIWLPWPIRNYVLTDRFIPATTHGGIQLWYGSLQVGEYFERWFDNPRAQLEASPFDYSLPGPQPLTVAARPSNPAFQPSSVALTYWTSRDPRRTTLAAERTSDATFSISLPSQPPETVVYYYLDATWATHDRGEVQQSTPLAGRFDPLRHVVTDNHFGDLDLNDDALDVFDLVRLVRHEVWQQPLTTHVSLDLDRDGRVSASDLDRAAGVLIAPAHQTNQPIRESIQALDRDDARARLVLKDGSSLTVPRTSLERTIDLDVSGSDQSMSANLIRSARSFAGLGLSPGAVPVTADHGPDFVLRTEVNKVFFRAEPLWMDRYTQLAAANIRRAPAAFVAASARRVLRMFFILGSDDRFRAAQFRGSGSVYAVATVLSLTYAVLFAAGVAIAWRRKQALVMCLLPILYIPATIFMFLPNMRYMVTAQPFVFIFMAVGLVNIFDAVSAHRSRQSSHRGSSIV